ncbi:hypothetical protein EP331_15575 [bacterium]|nr:MAG: hypothetical protein EP331_15575 [bacterium]
MKKIGVIRGMENSFPEALIAYINEEFKDKEVHAEFVQLDSVRMDMVKEYEVIIDRISHEVPFYRSFLKASAMAGTYVINNPFWWSADDKFIDNIIAEKVEVAVPRSVILPHREHPTNTQSTSYRNLKYPINWDAIFDYIKFPAFLKPHDGGGWRGVTKVTDPESFFKAYNESGQDCMMLQENIDFEEYYRCYGIGRKEVHIMKYNPIAPHHLRYMDVPEEPISAKMKTRIKKDVLALCKALGYDMNTVEFAVRDGVPYAIDFMNPAPDADYHSVGQENFEWVIKALGKFAVSKALQKNRPIQYKENEVFGPYV